MREIWIKAECVTLYMAGTITRSKRTNYNSAHIIHCSQQVRLTRCVGSEHACRRQDANGTLAPLIPGQQTWHALLRLGSCLERQFEWVSERENVLGTERKQHRESIRLIRGRHDRNNCRELAFLQGSVGGRWYTRALSVTISHS